MLKDDSCGYSGNICPQKEGHDERDGFCAFKNCWFGECFNYGDENGFYKGTCDSDNKCSYSATKTTDIAEQKKEQVEKKKKWAEKDKKFGRK